MHLANLRHLGDAMTAALSTPGMLDSLCANLAPSAVSGIGGAVSHAVMRLVRSLA